jgi:hypothetical protein
MTRVLICGDRNWTDYDYILETLKKYLADHTPNAIDFVIEGEANGADKLGRKAAEELGIVVLPYPAKWEQHGRAAGPIRNKQMLVDGKPDEVWAFHDNLSASKGTMNMIITAREKGIPVYTHSHNMGKFIVVVI